MSNRFANELSRLVEEAQVRQRVAAGQIVDQLSGTQVSPAAPGSPGTVALSSATPQTIGTAAAGSSGAASDGAHVHAINPATTGAAGSMSAADKTKADAYPAVSGLTTGTVLRATGATSAAFGAVDLASAAAVTGTLAVANGGTGVTIRPAFAAHKNNTAQTGIAASTWTKLTWSATDFNVNSNFTTSRFTPTVAGIYMIELTLQISGATVADQQTVIAGIWKNGTSFKYNGISASGAVSQSVAVTAFVQCNGSTDYVEAYIYTSNGAQTVNGYTDTTHFAGALFA